MKLQQALHPNLVKRLQHMVFVGVVMPREDGSTCFHVKCLSPVPQAIATVIVGRPLQFPGTTEVKQNEAVLALLTKEVQQHIVIFRLRYDNGSLSAELLQIQFKKPADSYQMIPTPYIMKGQTRETFEKKLVKGYVSFTLRKYSSDFATPELLLCENRLYGNISLKTAVSAIMYAEQKQNVLYCDIENLDDEDIICVDNHLYFVSNHIYTTFKKNIQENGRKLVLSAVSSNEKRQQGNKKEIAFLQHLKMQTRKKRLYIEELDLYNLHICLKTNPITIVAGLPGIGKSQLVKLYAEALGLKYGKELLWIPISPSIQEPQDILGYYHPNGVYMESETGLVQVLLEAQENPEQLYMIVFDEMNMSHIEHWFTPFLSLLELQEGERKLSLYNGEQKGVIPPAVAISSNILFVGTVNFDHTTKELSDRLLDRVPVLSFRKLSFREANVLREQPLWQEEESIVSATEYRKWRKCEDMFSVFSEEELELLDLLHSILQSHEPSQGISFRTAEAIASYLVNIPKDEEGVPLISRDEAFDLQLKQRVFTKLRGMEVSLKSLLAEDSRKEHSLLSVLQSPLGKEISAFNHSMSFLKNKARELELYGYVR